MDDLVTFIEAQLDIEERLALAAAGRNRIAAHWIAELWFDGTGERMDLNAGFGGWLSGQGALERSIAEHAARHDPARVLREVKAKRKAIESHRWHGPDGCEEDRFCPLLTAMASVWSDHPDFRTEWLTEERDDG